MIVATERSIIMNKLKKVYMLGYARPYEAYEFYGLFSSKKKALERKKELILVDVHTDEIKELVLDPPVKKNGNKFRGIDIEDYF